MTPHRRDVFRVLLGGSGMALSLPAFAQQTLSASVPVIGFLSARSASGDAHLIAAFRRGLEDTGFAEGRNVAINYRFADGHTDRLPTLASDLVNQQVALVVAAGGISTVAIAQATSAIPIVFISTSDPQQYHIVPHLNRPGGNATGVSLTTVEVAPKRIDLLLELVPQARVIALLVNPTTITTTPYEIQSVPPAAQARGCAVRVVNAASEDEFETAFAAMADEGADAVFVGTDPLFVKARAQLIALAARHKIPAIYDRREFPEAGGLMSYGPNVAAGYRRGGVYAGRILGGARPADLPVEQAAIFELVINVATAKALNLAIPPSLLASADEMIE